MKCKLEFHINYRTKPEETLVAKIFSNKKGHSLFERIYLQTNNGFEWHTRQEIDLNPKAEYTYHYVILKNGNEEIAEKAFPLHELSVSEKQSSYTFYDTWRWDVNQLNLCSSAFTDCIFKKHKNILVDIYTDEQCAEIKIHALLPQNGKYEIFLVGSNDISGNWDVNKGIKLQPAGMYKYSATIKSKELKDTQYKYVVVNKADNSVMWESGNNHVFPKPAKEGKTVIDDSWVRLSRFTDWRGAGIVIPLFSLHSSGSAGIGDFLDLKKFISWASGVGFSAIQLLPINDTTTLGTWRDSYPYNITSAYALHPIYIDLRSLINKYDPTLREVYIRQSAKLNKGKELDYENTLKFKNKILKAIYAKAGNDINNDKKYQAFTSQNKEWLLPYAAYCCLREKYKSTDFSKWTGFENYKESSVTNDKALLKKIQYHCFVQYIAHTQMKAAHEYAVKNGIILKGDIPIGVNSCGADVWTNPLLFNRDMSTGAPPDYFSEDGQNWGFPTYNWDEMAKNDFYWWKKRFTVMAQYFDAYRIDHVLGFFRIWEIPRYEKSAKGGHFSPALPYSKTEIEHYGFLLKPEYIGTLLLKDKNKENLLHVKINAHNEAAYLNLSNEQKKAFDSLYNDFFYRRHDEFWAKGAIGKLSAITKSTKMLPCAEDLGMLPGNVGKVLDDLSILSLEIQNMPKQHGVEFANTELYPYRSVATISTHDMPSFRLWWEKFPETAKRYSSHILHAPYTPEANVDTCEKVVRMHLMSPSMLCLLSFQDWTSICCSTRTANIRNEQINNPADPNQNWCYRAHLSVENLEQNTLFNEKIKELLTESNRNLFAFVLQNNI